MSFITSLLLVFLYRHAVDGSKQRCWLDSAVTLLEGSLPSARYGHGFAATEDGKIYAFGGYGPNGEISRCLRVKLSNLECAWWSQSHAVW